MEAQDEHGEDSFTAMIGAEAIRELLRGLSALELCGLLLRLCAARVRAALKQQSTP